MKKHYESPRTKQEAVDRMIDRLIGICLAGLIVALLWHGVTG